MLTDPTFNRPDQVLSMIAAMNGGPAAPKRIDQGLYLAAHWNVADLVRGGVRHRWDEDDPEWLDFEECGVCDEPEQVVEKFGLRDRPEPFFVAFVEIKRDDQPLRDGWRWHKWGPYIGAHEPQCEYLHDEPEIDRVFTYHIHELPSVPT